MITLTKPIERKGWRSTSVTRSRVCRRSWGEHAAQANRISSSRPSAYRRCVQSDLRLSRRTGMSAARPYA